MNFCPRGQKNGSQAGFEGLCGRGVLDRCGSPMHEEGDSEVFRHIPGAFSFLFRCGVVCAVVFGYVS